MKPYADLLKDDRVPRLRGASRRGPLAVTGRTGRRSSDYRSWSIEELRALATQLQLPGAGDKSRSELLRLFDGSAA